MYDLPQFDTKKTQVAIKNVAGNQMVQALFLLLVIAVALSFATGQFSVDAIKNQYRVLFQDSRRNELLEPITQNTTSEYVSRNEYEQSIIDTVKSASPSVVSIIISRYLPVYEEMFINPFGDNNPYGFEIEIPRRVQRGTEKKQVGAGSGFIVSEDGYVLTNKHVVLDERAEYTVLTNDGKKYPAKVVALDPVQDLAALKIQSDQRFPSIKLGDSNGIQVGQGAIAIGNSLGEFRNTVSVGIISGLGRTISASGDSGYSETLEDVIQTDAAINAGNSGGPLLNLRGEVIGVNVAMAEGAQTIGFAIPINIAKRDIQQVLKNNKITYPFLGIRYQLTDDGAVVSGTTQGSAAEKAGVKAQDTIVEINGQKVTMENSLSKVIQQYSPGDKVTLKILRNGQEMTIEVTLGERS